MAVNFLASAFLLGCVVVAISAWFTQKLQIRPFSQTRQYGRLLLKDKEFKKQLVVPGVIIPIDSISEAIKIATDNSLKDELGIVKFVVSAGGTIAGKKKSDQSAFNEIQKKYIDAVIANKDLPTNYQFFGNGKNEEILKQLLIHNPFFTSALQSNNDDSLSITSYSSTKDGISRYSTLLTAYDANFPRVNVKINRNTKEITSYQVFDGKGNDITSSYENKDDAVKLLLFTLMYYAEVIHAGIHIYNFINVIGILHSSEDSKKFIYPWAETYLRNVPLKYFEVEKLLLNVGGALVGGGFLGNRDQVLQYTVNELLKPWLHYSSSDDFINNFIFAGIPKVDQRKGFLPEFLEQSKLIPTFTNDFINAIKNSDNKAYNKLNTKLTKYYQDIGTGISNYTDVTTWLQIQSVLGIVHAGTLSFSRYIATPAFLPLLNISNTDTYTSQDEKIAITVLATTDGLTKDRYVFSSELLKNSPKLSPILKTYNDKSNALKTTHYETIKKDPKFAELGWIWTDFASDLIDNKQLTLTTYV